MLSIKIRPLWSPSDEENVWRYERVNQKSLYHWTDKTMNKRKTKDEKTKQWIKEKQKTKRQTMNKRKTKDEKNKQWIKEKQKTKKTNNE